MIPCVELHGRSVGHGSMHGIVWNHTDYMRPCMELHGSLMNFDPDRQKIDFKNFSDLFTNNTTSKTQILRVPFFGSPSRLREQTIP